MLGHSEDGPVRSHPSLQLLAPKFPALEEVTLMIQAPNAAGIRSELLQSKFKTIFLEELRKYDYAAPLDISLELKF